MTSEAVTATEEAPPLHPPLCVVVVELVFGSGWCLGPSRKLKGKKGKKRQIFIKDHNIRYPLYLDTYTSENCMYVCMSVRQHLFIVPSMATRGH